MTLDEAIAHAERKAENNYALAGSYHTDEGVYLEEETRCRQCAEEHEQLAEWLRELKAYHENNIKELEKIKAKLHKLAFDDDGEYMGVIDNDDAMDLIDNHISELKGGDEE